LSGHKSCLLFLWRSIRPFTAQESVETMVQYSGVYSYILFEFFFDIGNSFFFPFISFSSLYLFLSLISSPFTHNLFFLPCADLPPPPQVRLYTPVCVFFAYVWYSILCTGQYYGLNCYLLFVPSKHSYQNYNRTPYSL